MITKVTITGADDSIGVSELEDIWREYPFVEWGILMSKSQQGRYRYPSMNWLAGLYDLKKMMSPQLPISCHLCGTYVRNFVGTGEALLSPNIWKIFDRIQLNFHTIPHDFSLRLATSIRKDGREFIFQYDGINDETINTLNLAGGKVSALFDKSGGAGILPNEWPELLPRVKCGYAGGLSPGNLKEQIALIEAKAGDTEIWIDAETHVRSRNDSVFDLDKVRIFLSTAKTALNL